MTPEVIHRERTCVFQPSQVHSQSLRDTLNTCWPALLLIVKIPINKIKISRFVHSRKSPEKGFFLATGN